MGFICLYSNFLLELQSFQLTNQRQDALSKYQTIIASIILRLTLKYVGVIWFIFYILQLVTTRIYTTQLVLH